MGMTSTNTYALQLKETLNSMLESELLPLLIPLEGWIRSIETFYGKEVRLPSLGHPIVRNAAGDNPVFVHDSLDTGEILFGYKDLIVAATSVSRKMGEELEPNMMGKVLAEIPKRQAQAIAEQIHRDILALQGLQVSGNLNAINGYAHRRIGDGTNGIITLQDFAYANLSFNKANVADQNRIAIVDATVAYQFETATNLVNVSNNPMWEGIITSGMANNLRFVRNVYGFDVYCSNLLAPIATETITQKPLAGGSEVAKTITDGIANLFMCVGNEMDRPFAMSWKRMPTFDMDEKYETDREKLFNTTARYGLGLTKQQTLMTIITPATL